MRAWPDDQVDAELVWIECGHPVFPVGRAIVAAGEIAAAALFEVGEGFLLRFDVFVALDLFGD